jgi:hypothetical protein
MFPLALSALSIAFNNPLSKNPSLPFAAPGASSPWMPWLMLQVCCGLVGVRNRRVRSAALYKRCRLATFNIKVHSDRIPHLRPLMHRRHTLAIEVIKRSSAHTAPTKPHFSGSVFGSFERNLRRRWASTPPSHCRWIDSVYSSKLLWKPSLRERDVFPWQNSQLWKLIKMQWTLYNNVVKLSTIHAHPQCHAFSSLSLLPCKWSFISNSS